MENRFVGEEEYKILKTVLGEDVAEEFKAFIETKDEKKPRPNRSKRRKQRLRSRETREFIVDVSNYDEDDLVGWWVYDEDYIDDFDYREPKWFKPLLYEMEFYPNASFAIKFVGIDKTIKEVYDKLKKLKKTGRLSKDIKLPSRAYYGDFELPERTFPKPKPSERRNIEVDVKDLGFVRYDEDILR